MSATDQVRKPRRGDVLELLLDRLDAKGAAVGTLGAYTVRVRGGVAAVSSVPGARVRVEVSRRRRDAIEARALAVLEPSPDQVAPRCVHFGTCGGCARQDLAYAAQLRALEALLATWIAPVVEAGTRVDPVLGMREPWHYRNKMDFTFGNLRWVEAHEPQDAPRDFALGLHVPGRFDKVLDVLGCDIAFREAGAIVASARRLAREHALSAWDVREHRGLLRHLVLRKAFATGEILVYLVTSPGQDAVVEDYARALLAEHPEVTTLVHGTNDGLATVANAQVERVLAGAGTIRELLGGLSFTISPRSFFQTNTAQAERLAAIVVEAAAARAGDVVYDLYCGAGALSLVVAAAPAERRPRRTVGFELVEAAVLDARANALANGVSGTHFVAGDLVETLSAEARARQGLEPPDVCIVDPPRAGVHARVLEALVELAPRRIVYVSCNPRTGVRDLELLGAAGWRVRAVQPVDLFPHTPHLECVFTLERGERS